MKYTCIADPGHGWLRVPRAELVRLGIAGRITGFSYRHEDQVFLEEDQDMRTFLAAKKKAGEPVEIVDRYQENTPIRNYEPYHTEEA